jgi:hypothetical protein
MVPAQFVPLPDDDLVGLECALRNGALHQGSICQRALGTFDSTGSCHDGARSGRLDALGQRRGGESTEHRGMNGTQTDDGERCEQRGRDHRHFFFFFLN